MLSVLLLIGEFNDFFSKKIQLDIFMQIVSSRDNLHEMSSQILLCGSS